MQYIDMKTVTYYKRFNETMNSADDTFHLSKSSTRQWQRTLCTSCPCRNMPEPSLWSVVVYGIPWYQQTQPMHKRLPPASCAANHRPRSLLQTTLVISSFCVVGRTLQQLSSTLCELCQPMCLACHRPPSESRFSLSRPLSTSNLQKPECANSWNMQHNTSIR